MVQSHSCKIDGRESMQFVELMQLFWGIWVMQLVQVVFWDVRCLRCWSARAHFAKLTVGYKGAWVLVRVHFCRA